MGNSTMISVYKGVSHPNLCDIMGHMTTRHFIAMFDDASYHFLFQVFDWNGEQSAYEDIGWADVKHVIEYNAEVGAGDLLEISAELVKIGTKSITVNYAMQNLSRNELAATLESTSVLFDLKARKALALTDTMRSAADKYTA